MMMSQMGGGPRNTLQGRVQVQRPMPPPAVQSASHPMPPQMGADPTNTLQPRVLNGTGGPSQLPFRNMLQGGGYPMISRSFADIGNPGLRSVMAVPQGL